MKILAWLSSLNFKAKHQDVLSNHHPGTGQWIFDTPEFISWRYGNSKAIWCTGIPGAGKTILASIVIDKLQKELDTDGLAYVYCSYQNPEHTSINLIASILQQVAQRQPVLPKRIKDFYNRHATEGTKPALEEILMELQLISTDLSKVFVVVDALDECTDEKFLETMPRIGDQFRLLITSRTTTNVSNYLPMAVCINIDAKDADIAKYLKNRIVVERRLQRIIAGDFDLEETIIKTILRNAKGMFLLARLHLDSLAKKQNRRDIRLALDKLPRELYGTYDEAMQRLVSQDEQDVDLARSVLA